MWLSTVLVSLAALAPSAFNPVQDFAPNAIAADDPSGKSFEWNKRLPCGANSASVLVKFAKAYPIEKDRFLPVAKIWLHSGKSGDPAEQWAAAVFKAPTDTWKLNAVAWLEKDTQGGTEGPGYAPIDLSRPVRISLAWTSDGMVSVNFGGEFAKQISLNKPITDIGVGVTWTKFEFAELKVGRTGPPDPTCRQPEIGNSAQTPTDEP